MYTPELTFFPLPVTPFLIYIVFLFVQKVKRLHRRASSHFRACGSPTTRSSLRMKVTAWRSHCVPPPHSHAFDKLSRPWRAWATRTQTEVCSLKAFACRHTPSVTCTRVTIARVRILHLTLHLQCLRVITARVWYWTSGSTEANLAEIINRTKTLGAELVFFTDITSNIGDYEVDPKRFPSGFRANAQTVRDFLLSLRALYRFFEQS